MRASMSRSTYWLNAPAAADETITASASSATRHDAGAAPGVTARPASAVKPITSPMRSLNRSKTSAIRRCMTQPLLPYDSGQTVDRYFQFTK